MVGTGAVWPGEWPLAGVRPPIASLLFTIQDNSFSPLVIFSAIRYNTNTANRYHRESYT